MAKVIVIKGYLEIQLARDALHLYKAELPSGCNTEKLDARIKNTNEMRGTNNTLTFYTEDELVEYYKALVKLHGTKVQRWMDDTSFRYVLSRLDGMIAIASRAIADA